MTSVTFNSCVSDVGAWSQFPPIFLKCYGHCCDFFSVLGFHKSRALSEWRSLEIEESKSFGREGRVSTPVTERAWILCGIWPWTGLCRDQPPGALQRRKAGNGKLQRTKERERWEQKGFKERRSEHRQHNIISNLLCPPSSKHCQEPLASDDRVGESDS